MKIVKTSQSVNDDDVVVWKAFFILQYRSDQPHFQYIPRPDYFITKSHKEQNIKRKKRLGESLIALESTAELCIFYSLHMVMVSRTVTVNTEDKGSISNGGDPRTGVLLGLEFTSLSPQCF